MQGPWTAQQTADGWQLAESQQLYSSAVYRARPCIHNAWRSVWPFQPLPPAIFHRTRSPERPQKGQNDRTVSTTGACFNNLTPAGETVVLMHPAQLWARAIGVLAHRGASTKSPRKWQEK